MKAPKSREAPTKGTHSVHESEPTATSSVFHALDVDYDRVGLTSGPSDVLRPLHCLHLTCPIKQQTDTLLLSAAGPAAHGI